MKASKLLLIIYFSFSLFSCSEKGAKVEDIEKTTPQVLSFKFLRVNNDGLSSDITASIDHELAEITVTFPPHTELGNLTPTLTVSEGALVTPNSSAEQDFNQAIVYTLSGEAFETISYTVKASVKDSNEASIINFSFLAEDNAHLTADIPMIIEGSAIKAQISDKIDASALIPTIEISEGATINPASNQPVDFTTDVEYTVTAQDETTTSVYLVQLESLSSNNKITAFQFELDGETYNADIDYDTDKIALELPYNTDLNELTPIVAINEKASMVPASGVPQNFNNLITYTVTAEDGSSRAYEVHITTLTAAQNDRVVLEKLYRANEDYNTPFTYLDWDLEAATMDNWQGVTVTEGRVTKLLLSTIFLHEIPESIGELSELTNLTVAGTQLTKLPDGICHLKKLEQLAVYDNNLSVLPAELGKLEALKSIHLYDNNLEALPVSMEQMTNLMRIEVQNNNLNSLPAELANIPNLMWLNIKNNPLTHIPQVICDKKTEINGISIVITKDDDDMCN